MKTFLIVLGALLVGAGIMYVVFVRKNGDPLAEQWGTWPFSDYIINVGGNSADDNAFETQSFTAKPVVLPK